MLGGTLTVHLGDWKERYPIEGDEILRSLYVNDITLSENNIPEVKQLEASMIKIFREANF